MNGILVLVEHLRGEVRDITYEMLTKAGALAQAANSRVTALLLSDNSAVRAGHIAGFCDRLVAIDDPALKDFESEAYQAVLSDVIAAEQPGLVMLAHSALGVDLAPALAVKTGLPLVSDVVNIAYDGENWLFTRQMYAGKLNAGWQFTGPSGIVTVRPAAFRAGFAAQACAITKRPAGTIASRRKLLGYEEAPATGVDITRAGAIIAVGRGIREQKNMVLVENLARTIGAEIGCSRPVIDAGWLPKERQIGSSGKTVKPKLYIGLGISGAFQHTAGMKSAETIIAVNKDPNAPIFQLAHYGIVGDIIKVIPVLEARIKELKAA
jgi:electron transfer flavoprotein alpha subunit